MAIFILRQGTKISVEIYSCCPQGVRIVAENLGGNRFKVVAENVGKFRIYLSPEMGDLDRPFAVELGDGRVLPVNIERISGERDYMARLNVDVL